MSFLTPSDDDARADDEILAWAAPDDFASTYETVPPDPFDPDVPPALPESQHGAYDAPYSAPAELSDPAFEEPAFADPAYAEPAFEEGARDGRHEPVGLNRRLVLGTALAFVALVLLGLMLVTGGGDEPQTAASGETREAATPEFIDRPPATDEAPAFAEPEPFAYQTPQDVAAPMAAADPYAPAPYTAADYGAYDVPNNAATATPSTPSGSASGYAAAPRRAADADPREEGYLRARTSALMVDGSAGSMGTGASARPAAPRTGGLNLSASQREAYDALDPETQSAYREALQLSAAFGINVAGGDAEAAGSAAAPPEAPAARSGMLVAVPRGDGDQEAEAGPGPASRAAFLRRAQSAGTQEPFRVRTSGAAARPAVRSSPAARRGSTPRGPAAGDELSADEAPPGMSLLPGTVIPAILVTGMNSELPGDVVAQVERDVFDSATLRHILIPKGTRLVGDVRRPDRLRPEPRARRLDDDGVSGRPDGRAPRPTGRGPPERGRSTGPRRPPLRTHLRRGCRARGRRDGARARDADPRGRCRPFAADRRLGPDRDRALPRGDAGAPPRARGPADRHDPAGLPAARLPRPCDGVRRAVRGDVRPGPLPAVLARGDLPRR